MSKKVLLLVGDYVEDYEAMVPLQVLLTVGHHVDVVSPDKKAGDTVKTAIHDFLPGEQTYVELKGHNFSITKDWTAVDGAHYDGLLIPGGRAPEFLRQRDDVLKLVQHFCDTNKPLGAICHGPLVLTAIPGFLKGRKATAYPALKWDLLNAGAQWSDQCPIDGAVTDGHLVTGCAWPGHPAWLKAFIGLLGTKFQL
uniref:DJ-1/PfpI domain-containing protein n=1 Tax=Arcella intermedia TaxID=1963864 RepID=A0A6B2LJL6_9EUKA|eukprot:TRINITY_DN5315_c0_g1_i1.p2 TRINITY_DN5315_c0_g1~~TRINITY_DN5315_c0_g1_i1.p2  ORF type:complete len:196 (+),score=31.70 TRINITY_DN5315_c0_g1_i1:14-601(+)